METDIFALGTLLYELYLGVLPHEGAEVGQCLERYQLEGQLPYRLGTRKDVWDLSTLAAIQSNSAGTLGPSPDPAPDSCVSSLNGDGCLNFYPPHSSVTILHPQAHLPPAYTRY